MKTASEIGAAILERLRAQAAANRAIAKRIGVYHKTVGAARKKSTGEHSPVKRIGQDGKERKLPELTGELPLGDQFPGVA